MLTPAITLNLISFVCIPGNQCNQKKITKCLLKLSKNDFTRKMIGFDTFTKVPSNVGDLGKFIVAKGFKKLPKVQ